MAIGARTSPELLVVGTVIGRRDQTWDGEKTGVQVTVDTLGGPVLVKFASRDGSDKIAPAFDQNVVIVATVYDGQNGATLSFDRFLSADDLDRVASYSGALASAGK